MCDSTTSDDSNFNSASTSTTLNTVHSCDPREVERNANSVCLIIAEIISLLNDIDTTCEDIHLSSRWRTSPPPANRLLCTLVDYSKKLREFVHVMSLLTEDTLKRHASTT